MTCPTCGAVADDFIVVEANYTCTECGSTLNEVDVVPKDGLRELIERWRQRAESNRQVGQSYDARQNENCADELENLL